MNFDKFLLQSFVYFICQILYMFKEFLDGLNNEDPA